jgi:hypothetical protein
MTEASPILKNTWDSAARQQNYERGRLWCGDLASSRLEQAGLTCQAGNPAGK